MPTRALLDNRRIPVRVLAYEGNGYFTVLDATDAQLYVHRNRLEFIK